MRLSLPELDYLNSILECRDGVLYHKVNRGSARAGSVAGQMANRYWTISINKKIYYAHRVIFFMTHGWCPEYIDHINGDKKDNRIENLRPATHQQNCGNSPIRKANTHGAKNLTFDKRSKFWYVFFRINGVKRNFGCFKDKNLATEFADLAREIIYGQFARHA